MAAIITDQLRILNAKNFVAGVQSSTNSYYAFIGLPNATNYQTDWDTNPPSPRDNLNESNDYWDTMLAMKKIGTSDVSQVVRKNTWSSGVTYDMWRNDISIDKQSLPSGVADIYDANYYVMNSDYRVYICLFNNANPENNFQGGPSLDEPTFTDLEPRAWVRVVTDISGNIFILSNQVKQLSLTLQNIFQYHQIGMMLVVIMYL